MEAVLQPGRDAGIFADLEKWIQRRLRALHVNHWNRGRTTFRALTARGLPEYSALPATGTAGRWLAMANPGSLETALSARYFDALGVPCLAPY